MLKVLVVIVGQAVIGGAAGWTTGKLMKPVWKRFLKV